MSEYTINNNINGSGNVAPNNIPHQTISESKKNDAFLENNADFFYKEAVKQVKRNAVFTDIRKMTQGEFTYRAVDIERTLSGSSYEADLKRLSSDLPIATHLKHFDFLGIIANAIISVFGDLDDLYRVEAVDEYTTNEYIREKTKKYEKYAQSVFELEVNRMLFEKGINPKQEEFESEEEQQQYMQKLQEEVSKYTPAQVEKDLAKNFKVAAVDWANNTLTADKEKFNLDKEDKKALLNYILTGRWFRHYRMGYDNYVAETWNPEEVFFSQDLDTEYPQNCEFVGKLTEMSLSNALIRHGHLMTTKQQTKVGNFWGTSDDYKKTGTTPIGATEDGKEPFGKHYVLPFENYFDHQVNLQMEDALGAPLAQTMDEDGNVTRHFMPRSDFSSIRPHSNVANRRSDIDVRNDMVEVMEVYWRSMKKIGVLIYENELGQTDIKTTTEELLKDFLKENDIKVKNNISLQELQTALLNKNLDEYKNTITYHFLPEIRYLTLIKGKNSLTSIEDIILDGKPIIQQIKGDSNLYEVRIPVGGLISVSPITKAFPFQQLHNVCLNQITELLADEPGTFYSLDINSLPAEYKDQTTEEALFSVMDTIKMNKLLPMDFSRVNTQGSATYPNIFQKNELVFKEQVLYRREMAMFFKEQGFQQLGITPQMLGAPTKYESAEGVSQQATASYALMSVLIDDFNSSKAKANELHIAIAQQCEVNGKSSTRLIKNSDGANSFIDILAEDPDYFPLRRLNVLPASSSKDRAIVASIKQMMLTDNTIQKDLEDIVDIFTNPYLIEMKQVASEIRKRNQKSIEEDRAFQGEQTDKQIQARKEEVEDLQSHERDLADIKGQWQYKSQYLVALGRDSASTPTDDFDQITEAFKINMEKEQLDTENNLKSRESFRKERMDTDKRELEKQKLILKAREIETRERISNNTVKNSIINKN
jgi:hypothetical protein